MSDFHDAVKRAALIVGGQAKLAAMVGRAQSEISRLCTTAQSIAPDVAIAISKATDGQVPIRAMLPEFVDAVAAELGVDAA